MARHSEDYLAYGDTDEEEQEVDEQEANRKASVWQVLKDDARSGDALGKLARHEAMLMNAFTKTLQMLLLLQDKRSSAESEPVMVEAVALPPAA